MEQQKIQELIEQSKRNNTQAFALLVSEYQELVFRLAFRLLCDEDEAKDMVQEVFIKIWLSLHNYNSKYKFSTWLYKVASNACYDRLRQINHKPEGQKSTIDLSSLHLIADENTEKRFINEELKTIILALTEQLTPKQKLVFVLCDIEELSVSEIEAITGLTDKKIKSNLYLARKFIREKINLLTK